MDTSHRPDKLFSFLAGGLAASQPQSILLLAAVRTETLSLLPEAGAHFFPLGALVPLLLTHRAKLECHMLSSSAGYESTVLFLGFPSFYKSLLSGQRVQNHFRSHIFIVHSGFHAPSLTLSVWFPSITQPDLWEGSSRKGGYSLLVTSQWLV